MNAETLHALALPLGKLPSGLFILTAKHGECETGMLVSWVQQCSFDPPQLTVVIRPNRDIVPWLTADAPFTLNLLAEGQTNLLSHFGKGFSLDQPAFTGLNVERADGQAPILSDALGYLLCRVVTRVSAGDHDLFIAGVVGGRLLRDEAKPYVHVRKNGLRY